MNRKITQGDRRSLRRIIRKHIVRSDHDFGMLRTEYIERVEVDDMAADLVEWADRRALRTSPAPAPSAATARHERAVAYADDVAEGGAPVPDDYERHYCTDDGEDWPCGAARAARVPEAAVERAARAMQAENAPKPDPLNRDQREEQDDATIATYRTLARAALAAALPLLTAAPSATRDEVARLIDPSGWRYFDTGMFPPDHPASTGIVHNSRETADALLARFTITPKEDR